VTAVMLEVVRIIWPLLCRWEVGCIFESECACAYAHRRCRLFLSVWCCLNNTYIFLVVSYTLSTSNTCWRLFRL